MKGYSTVITPYGVYDSILLEGVEFGVASNALSNVGSLDSFAMVLEDGSSVYMNKEMIGKSLFFLKEIEDDRQV